MPAFDCRLPLVVLCSALTVACGAKPGSVSSAAPPEITTGAAQPTPGPSSSAQPGSVGALIAHSHEVFAAMPMYHLRLAYTQKSDTESSKGVYDIYGQQPRTMKIEVVEGSGEGTKLLWKGGKDVQVRPSGFLSALTLNLPLGDSRLVSIRGYTLAQTDLSAMYGYMTDAANKATQLAADTFDVTGPHLLSGVTHMRATVDLTTWLPKTVTMTDAKNVAIYTLGIEKLVRTSGVTMSI